MLDPHNICWNLFLALIPVALGLIIGWLSRHDTQLAKRWIIWLPLMILWAGFLPNTCYLLTEWRHFIEIILQHPDQVRQAPHSEDAILAFLSISTFYVVYSGLGLLTFSMSLWPIVQWLKPARLVKFVFFLICALGVYLGLIQRLNTWDIRQHTGKVFADSAYALTHPFIVAMIICFAIVIWGNYWIFEVFIDGLLLRLNRQSRA